jgi:hypothetical protein
MQNFPTIASAVTSGGSTAIRGTLNSTPGDTFTIRFFSNPSGANEGKRFIDQTNVTTGPDGRATFTFSPANAVPVGQKVTATDAGGNTSEFSAPRTVAQQ